MLIACTECGRQVSSAATACPGCGNPIASAGAGTPVVAIEQTAKRWKAMQLIGALMTLGGFASCVISAKDPSWPTDVAVFLLFPGIIVVIAGKILAWWHHG